MSLLPHDDENYPPKLTGVEAPSRYMATERRGVPVGAGKLTEAGGLSTGMPLAINEGYYQAALDVVSLQLGASF